ncbi:MAG: response regulator [Thermodesulfobacteriota bacterium]
MESRRKALAPRIPPRILLAEEEDGLRHSMALMLKQAGCTVGLARGVMEAARLLRESQGSMAAYDLFIVDLGDATAESCRLLVEWFDGEGIVVPYLVIYEDAGDRAVGYLAENGCLACISKPFEPNALLQGVRRAIGREWQPDSFSGKVAGCDQTQ